MPTPIAPQPERFPACDRRGLPEGALVDANCLQLNRHVFTCHDYMTITLWGEGYLTFRLLNGWLDKCDLDSSLNFFISEYLRRSVEVRGLTREQISNADSFRAYSENPTEQCLTVYAGDIGDCFYCYFQRIATRLNFRHSRQTQSWWKGLRRKLGRCHGNPPGSKP